MNIQFTFKNIDEDQKQEIEEYAASKVADLAGRFKDMPEDSFLAKVDLESMEKHTAFRASIQLDIKHGKSHSFKAEEVKHSYTESLDNVKDMLAKQIQQEHSKKADKAKEPIDIMEEEEELF